MLPLKKKSSDIFEKAISWFWVVLFISAVLYLRWLLVEMDTQTTRLGEERERFKIQIGGIQEENEKLYEKIRASFEGSLKNTNVK